MFDRRLKREIRDLKATIQDNKDVIRMQAVRNFKLVADNIELKNRLSDMTKDRDAWKDIAHSIDRARREMLRRTEAYGNSNPKEET